MVLSNRLFLCAALALAAACGGKSEDGESGGSGGSGGGSGGSGGGSGGSGGTMGMSCSELAKAYAVALAEAKLCNSLINSLQCTQMVDDVLDCPCSTFVNPANTEAMQKLGSLKAEWGAKQCMEGRACPAIACVAPQGGGCQPNGAGGDADGCVDFGPD